MVENLFYNMIARKKTLQSSSDDYTKIVDLLSRFAIHHIDVGFSCRKTLSASDLRDETTSGLIASKLKEFHELEIPGAKEVRMWERLRNWLKTAKADCPEKEKKLFHLDEIDGEITLLEKELSKDGQLIGFCHNDLQYGNIMIDEETHSITIIFKRYNRTRHEIVYREGITHSQAGSLKRSITWNGKFLLSRNSR